MSLLAHSKNNLKTNTLEFKFNLNKYSVITFDNEERKVEQILNH